MTSAREQIAAALTDLLPVSTKIVPYAGQEVPEIGHNLVVVASPPIATQVPVAAARLNRIKVWTAVVGTGLLGADANEQHAEAVMNALDAIPWLLRTADAEPGLYAPQGEDSNGFLGYLIPVDYTPQVEAPQ